jgi:hypothetical protein
MMQREFSPREKTLLLILVFLILAMLYYVAVHQNIVTNITDADLRSQFAQSELALERARLDRLETMQAELEIYKEDPTKMIAPVPDYDNIQPLMIELNRILQGSTGYNLVFPDIDFTSGLARRSINMTFGASDYAKAKSILNELMNCKYRNLVGTVSFTAVGNDLKTGAVTVKMDITFYEMYQETTAGTVQ